MSEPDWDEEMKLHSRIAELEADKQEMLEGMERMDAENERLKEVNRVAGYVLSEKMVENLSLIHI